MVIPEAAVLSPKKKEEHHTEGGRGGEHRSGLCDAVNSSLKFSDEDEENGMNTEAKGDLIAVVSAGNFLSVIQLS